MNRIGIIGAGALGARHLQAFALSEDKYEIWVADPFQEALDKAKVIFEGTQGSEGHCLNFTMKISEFPEELDAVIVATNSNVRRKVIEELLSDHKVTYLLLEKVLFQKLEDYDAIRELLDKTNTRAWVNCGRRMMDVYKDLRERLKDATTMEISVFGSDWGMGCNGIHMIDLIAYLAGDDNLVVDVSELSEEYIDSKRKGFLEIRGTISGSVGKCKAFRITSLPEQGCSFTIQIVSDTVKCVIEETTGNLLISEKSNDWKWKQESFRMTYQSERTQIAVKEMLETGKSELTEYCTSTYYHKALIGALIPYFRDRGIMDDSCPIT